MEISVWYAELGHQNVGLNKTEQAMISLLIENADYTADKMAEKIGVAKRTIERNMLAMICEVLQKMIKVLFICHGRTKDYCSVVCLVGQKGAKYGTYCGMKLRLDYDSRE